MIYWGIRKSENESKWKVKNLEMRELKKMKENSKQKRKR